MHIASIGIDLGKTTFHLVALGERNKILLRKKFSRTPANLPAFLEVGEKSLIRGTLCPQKVRQAFVELAFLTVSRCQHTILSEKLSRE
jgi:hypothetical protein